MGQQVDNIAFSRADRTRYRWKMRRCLDVFAQMLDQLRFDRDRPMTGLELEVSLIDKAARPAMRNAEVLAALDDPMVQTELGQFTLEINSPPRMIAGDGLAGYEHELLELFGRLADRAAGQGARVVMIGVLPTLTQE